MKMQDRVISRIKENAEAAELEVNEDWQFANTGVLHLVDPDEPLVTLGKISLDFQNGYMGYETLEPGQQGGRRTRVEYDKPDDMRKMENETYVFMTELKHGPAAKM